MSKWPWIERTFNFDFPPSKFPDILERLRGTPIRIAEWIAGLKQDTLIRHDGLGWSIQENIGHLADVELLGLGRLDEFDSGAETLRPADMSNRASQEANHNLASIEMVLNTFRRNRGQFIDRLERLDPERYGQTAIHPRLNQPMRIVDLMYFVAEHDDYHLARIGQLVRKFTGGRHLTVSVGPSGPVQLDAAEGYDLWSKVYDEEKNPLVMLDEQVVRGWIADPRGLLVADVGCGTGRHAIWLAERGADVTAYDASSGMMAKAEAKLAEHGVRFFQHTLPKPLPVEAEAFDLILFALVADHIEKLGPVMVDLRRVLKRGGCLIFTVLHPAMNLLGLTARFTDPTTGREVRVAAFEHTYADYMTAILGAGLVIDDLVERKADESLTKMTSRAEKYLDWPMLLAMRLRKP
jgi:malonyl-CoA O-methyltransferase